MTKKQIKAIIIKNGKEIIDLLFSQKDNARLKFLLAENKRLSKQLKTTN